MCNQPDRLGVGRSTIYAVLPRHELLIEEWAYARFYPNNQARLDALPGWLDFYNHRRRHTALKRLTPAATLVNNVGGNHS